ncbi:S1C family serine protease [Alkalihalobacterium alkalinitrilicum]|uniref:S1C family serine protease n=1 Tax=Alkalihalobacterium alkalinitrilicum TaxID=427920 RepID=UPI00099556A8|nr:trypsin-like peptidase domain-containing protein [Alkalihalobacterium alkalinitrilicum]
MNSKWLVSILSTLLIWVLGITAFFFLSDWVPAQLQIESTLLTEEESDPSEEYKQEKSLKEIIHETQKSVVMIEVEKTGSTGSGFFYNNKGDVITNAHVVAGAQEVKVKLADTSEHIGTVIGISTDIDVALVRVTDLEGIKPLPLAKEIFAELGDEVLALGSPLGFQNTVTTGIISGVNRSFELENYQYDNAYQISAPIAKGNSGGPLISLSTGDVIGINSAATDVGTIGFSIPILNIISLVNTWSETPMNSLPSLENSINIIHDSSSTEKLALNLVDYFYESIDLQDYVTAYSLLGHSWQLNMNYEQFRQGYLNTRSVRIEDIYSITNEEEVKVIAIISTEQQREKDKEITTQKYKVTYEVGYENDHLKLISGTGEEIQ